MLKILCQCGESYQASEEHVGRQIHCRRCGRNITVERQRSAEEKEIRTGFLSSSWQSIMRIFGDPCARPYCDRCRVIYERRAAIPPAQCTKCGNRLRIKSFNPWPTASLGVLAIAAGVVTVCIAEVPIIWIGGFLLGGSIIANAFRNWFRARGLG